MAAYIISERYEEVEATGDLATYHDVTGKIVDRHKGRYVSVTRRIEMMEGDDKPLVVGIIEFPDMAAARAFFNDPEYQEIVGLRRSARMRVFIFDGERPAHARDVVEALK